jgi:HPt (histidine-containing phosphotransfer) domain-containing protein
MSRFLDPQNPLNKTLVGDVEIMHRLLTKFAVELKKGLEAWEEAFTERKEKEIFEIQHRWLSGLRTLGYEEISKKIAQEQENITQAQWPSKETDSVRFAVNSTLEDLEKELQSIDRFIKEKRLGN